MANEFQPPPTYALPILVEERTATAIFNPIWLKWFLDLAQWLTAAGGTVINITITTVANQVFDSRNTATAQQVRSTRNNGQNIIAGQVFGG